MDKVFPYTKCNIGAASQKDILGKRASLAPPDQQQPSCQRLVRTRYKYRGTPNNKLLLGNICNATTAYYECQMEFTW